MVIRQLTTGDIAAHEKLVSAAFSLKTDPFSETALPSANMQGAFTEDGFLAADMEAGKKTAFVCGCQLRCAAVGGVCCHPLYRGKGAVRMLFDALHSSAAFDLAVLHPFSTEFYAKLGYGVCCLNKTVRLPSSCFSRFARNNSVYLYEGENRDEMLSAYNRLASRGAFSLMREKGYDGRLYDNPYSVCRFNYYLRGGSGEITAVCIIIPDREKNTVFVEDLLFEDRNAFEGICGFLNVFAGNFTFVEFSGLPENSPVTLLFGDLKKVDIGLSSPVSAKIINYPAVLSALEYTRDGEFTFETEKKVYTVTVDGGRAVCLPSEKCPCVRLTSAAAATVFLGGKSEEKELMFVPGAEILTGAEAFFGMIKKKDVFIYEDF